MSETITCREMPTSCAGCEAANQRLGICETDKRFRAIGEQGRPDYCPLAPGPEDGGA